MTVLNIHGRRFPRTDRENLGALIDSLARGADDRLWPHDVWPAMRLDRPLSVGAIGGHGPIRYRVEHHSPGHGVRFRFDAPRGFDGTHGFEIVDIDADTIELRHTLAMRTRGPARLSWPLLFRPLHDALIEDALARAQRALGRKPDVRPWSPWVRLLRRLFSRRKAPPRR